MHELVAHCKGAGGLTGRCDCSRAPKAKKTADYPDPADVFPAPTTNVDGNNATWRKGVFVVKTGLRGYYVACPCAQLWLNRSYSIFKLLPSLLLSLSKDGRIQGKISTSRDPS